MESITYRRSKKGFLCYLYSNIKNRTKGVSTRSPDLYQGLELLTRQEFYEWANISDKFHCLFSAWISHDYSRKYTPSVDRIDGKQGYCIDNLQWLTFSENCSKAGKVKKPRRIYENSSHL